jgi:hypothetical protein
MRKMIMKYVELKNSHLLYFIFLFYFILFYFIL